MSTLPQPTSGLILKKKWKCGKLLGAGSHASVFEAVDIEKKEKNNKYVIKVCPVPPPKSKGKKKLKEQEKMDKASADTLYHETIMYSTHLYNFSQAPSFATTKGLGDDGNFRYVVIDRLGMTLQQDYEKNDNYFPPKKLSSIGIQLLNALSALHNRQFLFGDTKPDNFMFGREEEGEEDKVYLVDFGLSEKFVVMGSHRENMFAPGKGLLGTPSFLSNAVVEGHTPSRRDEIEAVGLVLIHFLLDGKSLPWSCATSEDELRRMKVQISAEELCEECIYGGKEMVDFLKKARQLAYEEVPDYKGFEQILKKIASIKYSKLPTSHPTVTSSRTGQEKAKRKGTSKNKKKEEERPRKRTSEKTSSSKTKGHGSPIILSSDEEVVPPAKVRRNQRKTTNTAEVTSNEDKPVTKKRKNDRKAAYSTLTTSEELSGEDCNAKDDKKSSKSILKPNSSTTQETRRKRKGKDEEDDGIENSGEIGNSKRRKTSTNIVSKARETKSSSNNRIPRRESMSNNSGFGLDNVDVSMEEDDLQMDIGTMSSTELSTGIDGVCKPERRSFVGGVLNGLLSYVPYVARKSLGVSNLGGAFRLPSDDLNSRESNGSASSNTSYLEENDESENNPGHDNKISIEKESSNKKTDVMRNSLEIAVGQDLKCKSGVSEWKLVVVSGPDSGKEIQITSSEIVITGVFQTKKSKKKMDSSTSSSNKQIVKLNDSLVPKDHISLTKDKSSVSYSLTQLSSPSNLSSLSKLERSEYLSKGGIFVNKLRAKNKKGMSIFAGDTIEIGDSKLMLTR